MDSQPQADLMVLEDDTWIIHDYKSFFTCKLCDKRYTTKGNLRRHMVIHTKEETDNYTQPGKGLRHERALAKKTSVKKPFTCTECGKGFCQKSYLKDHMTVHSGEQRYICPQCDKTFTQRGHLLDHIRIHTGEKPFSCDLCDKSFRQKGILNRHIKTQHSRAAH